MHDNTELQVNLLPSIILDNFACDRHASDISGSDPVLQQDRAMTYQ